MPSGGGMSNYYGSSTTVWDAGRVHERVRVYRELQVDGFTIPVNLVNGCVDTGRYNTLQPSSRWHRARRTETAIAIATG